VDVINMSFHVVADGTNADSIAQLNKAISDVCAVPIVCVASVSNSGGTADVYPSAWKGVFAVAASTLDDHVWVSSDYGNAVDLASPGVDIWSPYPGSHYGRNSGTSFATPLTAGTVALLKTLSHNLSPSDAASHLMTTADPLLPTNGLRPSFGRLDAQGAVCKLRNCR
jgi:subtilisin family serine protease